MKLKKVPKNLDHTHYVHRKIPVYPFQKKWQNKNIGGDQECGNLESAQEGVRNHHQKS